MSTTKDIREKINGIRNIQKIAKAMEMISAAKMHKAQNRMLISQPYSENIRKVIKNVAAGQLEYKHPYFIKRNVQCVGYWVISSDRGLAGGLNSSLFKSVLLDINKWRSDTISSKLAVFGLKAADFFKDNIFTRVVSCISGIGDVPKMITLIGSIKVMLQLYDNHEIDRLYLAYNKFINTLSQVPTILQILPIVPIKQDILCSKHWDYLYEPDSKILLDILLKRYIESQVYQGVVENTASEQSARMVAMKTAADNGQLLINDLQLLHNQVRQTKITQEIMEIISGAAVI